MAERSATTLAWQLEAYRLLSMPEHQGGMRTRDLHVALRAAEYRLSDRAVREGLRRLEERELIRAERDGNAWLWRCGWSADLRANHLDPRTALGLVLAESLLQAFLPTETRQAMAELFEAARAKLQGAPHQSVSLHEKVRVLPTGQALIPAEFDGKVRDDLLACLMRDERCEIEYRHSEHEAPSREIVSPLALCQRGAVLYLIARPGTALDEVPRCYPLHRIDIVQRRYENFDRGDFHLDCFLAYGTAGVHRPDEQIQLELLLSLEAGRHLFDTPLAVGQRLIRAQDGRHLHLHATVPLTPQLRRWIWGFGDQAEVIAPIFLREEMQVQSRALHARYLPPKAYYRIEEALTQYEQAANQLSEPAFDQRDRFNALDELLKLAYERTEYWVRATPPLCFHVNQSAEALDDLLRTHGVDKAVFLSACNPRGVWSSRQDNQQAQALMLAQLQRANHRFLPAVSVDPDGLWSPEESVLILGWGLEQAISCGRSWQQSTLIYVSLGEPPRLVFC